MKLSDFKNKQHIQIAMTDTIRYKIYLILCNLIHIKYTSHLKRSLIYPYTTYKVGSQVMHQINPNIQDQINETI